MSRSFKLVPTMRDMWHDVRHDYSDFDDDLWWYERPSMRSLRRYRPTTSAPERREVALQKDKFKIDVDVKQFTPNEITVKVKDNSILVEAKHEEKEDEHGYVSRQFTRRYVLPDGVDLDKITSSLTPEGFLVVEAPKKVPESAQGVERSIPISGK